jgi:membrane-associated phospholipid phosphatase
MRKRTSHVAYASTDEAPGRVKAEVEPESWLPGFGPRAKLITGCVLLAAVAIVGWYLSSHGGLNPVDRLAFRIIPNEWTEHPLIFIADCGRPRVVIPAVAFCFFISLLWSRRRAITCVIAPLIAVGITEYIAKPAVGRTFGGTLCYPSGHMTAVASVIAVFVLAVPPRFRGWAAVIGVIVDSVVGVTLMLLRWHYLTDVCAGASVAIGTTLIVDAIVHYLPLPGFLSERRSGQTATS